MTDRVDLNRVGEKLAAKTHPVLHTIKAMHVELTAYRAAEIACRERLAFMRSPGPGQADPAITAGFEACWKTFADVVEQTLNPPLAQGGVVKPGTLTLVGEDDGCIVPVAQLRECGAPGPGGRLCDRPSGHIGNHLDRPSGHIGNHLRKITDVWSRGYSARPRKCGTCEETLVPSDAAHTWIHADTGEPDCELLMLPQQSGTTETGRSPYGTGCRCPKLGEGTPEHAPGFLCRPGHETGTPDARPEPGN